uniref:Uncharacterized protein n=1 Tax=Rhizophora mucronata TaxID=61149 RepID=A0A2P2J408_RHIMU
MGRPRNLCGHVGWACLVTR